MTISEINAVVTEIHVAARPETVFPLLVDPRQMERWVGTHVELDSHPGGQVAIDISPHIRARGEFVTIEPPERVVFTFGWLDDANTPPGSSTVEITLTPDGDGTLVRLVHRGLMTAEMREEHREGWTQYLARLAALAAGNDPGPDPNASATPPEPRS